jgi:hypothetical protein
MTMIAEIATVTAVLDIFVTRTDLPPASRAGIMGNPWAP